MRRRARQALDLVVSRTRRAPASVPPGPARALAGADDAEVAIVEAASPHSMTPSERLLANVDAVDHVLANGVPGALVECGVWRGGSVLAMVLALQRRGVEDRDVFLYDTFEGMTEPTEVDVSRFDAPALDTWRRATRAGRVAWEYLFRPDTFGLEQVRDLLMATGYPPERIHFVVGPVEETIPGTLPEQVAVLRLDTDWYESTRHEMTHLYPRLSPGGVFIVDDYGHWDGSRRAVDEHLAAEPLRPLLTRIDYAARMGVKP